MRRGVTRYLHAAMGMAAATAMLFLRLEAAAEVRVEIEPIGESTVLGDGAPRTTTIWSIKVGEPELGERLAVVRHGVDGVILTPTSDGRWRRGVHRSLWTAEREDGVKERPVVVRRLESGNSTLLPSPLRGIDAQLVSEIVIYEAGGGMRINFKAGVPEEQVRRVLRDLAAASGGK